MFRKSCNLQLGMRDEVLVPIAIGREKLKTIETLNSAQKL